MKPAHFLVAALLVSQAADALEKKAALLGALKKQHQCSMKNEIPALLSGKPDSEIVAALYMGGCDPKDFFPNGTYNISSDGYPVFPKLFKVIQEFADGWEKANPKGKQFDEGTAYDAGFSSGALRRLAGKACSDSPKQMDICSRREDANRLWLRVEALSIGDKLDSGKRKEKFIAALKKQHRCEKMDSLRRFLDGNPDSEEFAALAFGGCDPGLFFAKKGFTSNIDSYLAFPKLLELVLGELGAREKAGKRKRSESVSDYDLAFSYGMLKSISEQACSDSESEVCTQKPTVAQIPERMKALWIASGPESDTSSSH